MVRVGSKFRVVSQFEIRRRLTSMALSRCGAYPQRMDREIEAFVAAWLTANAGVIDEIVALQGDDPTTAYGAAVEAAMATVDVEAMLRA